MELLLERQKRWANSTTGDLFRDGAYQCRTMEDKWRPDPNPATPQNEGKVWGQTCIPAGRYKVIWNKSPKFGKFFPRLVDVPGFDGILMHPANTHEEITGCIAVGQRITKDGAIAAGTSRAAYVPLGAAIQKAHEAGEEIWITITEPWGEEA